MLKRKNLQSEWEKIIKKGSFKYNTLNRNERVWFNIEPLTNCGLIDHYTNYGAEKNSDILEDLKYLNLLEIYNLFTEVNALFKEKRPSKNIDKRSEEILLIHINRKVLNKENINYNNHH